MKVRILFLVLLAFFICAEKSQASPWCSSYVRYAVSAHNITYGPGQAYIASESYTYAVSCFSTFYGAQPYQTMNDSATATGALGYYPAVCNPTWDVRSGPGNGSVQAWFTVSGQSYTGGTTSAEPCQTGPQQVNTVLCSIGCPSSPIILDLNGQGFHLTDAACGVVFDIAGDGNPVQIAWTAIGAENAFLALPGPDGLVHSGKELFGNYTPQPPSDDPNGFLALAVYDTPEKGGNGNGEIDPGDAIYPLLRLWIDANHDGICQSNELHTLSSLGVYSISLKYTESLKTDEYGNIFRYKSAVNLGLPPDGVDRTDYDIFLVTAP